MKRREIVRALNRVGRELDIAAIPPEYRQGAVAAFREVEQELGRLWALEDSVAAQEVALELAIGAAEFPVSLSRTVLAEAVAHNKANPNDPRGMKESYKRHFLAQARKEAPDVDS